MPSRKSITSRSRAGASRRGEDWRVLNVRSDSRKSRGIRRAVVIRQTFKIAMCTIAVVMAFVMVKHAFHRMLFQNEHFALQDIEFRTDGKLSRAVVLDKTGLVGSENLLELDLRKVETMISQLPTVAEATVEKRLPNGLFIEISERQPVAWLSCSSLGIRPRSSTSGQLIDAEGHAIACDRLRIEYMSFPVIEVSELPAVVTGRKIESDTLKAALHCLAEGSAILMPMRASITEIHARNDYSLLVVLNSGEEAIISNDQVESDMTRFATAYQALSRDHEDQRAWRVNLLAQRNVPLVYLDRERESRAEVRTTRSEPVPMIPRARAVDPETFQPISQPRESVENRGSSVDDDLSAILNRG